MKSSLLRTATLVMLLCLGLAHAFTRDPTTFPEGDQSYTFEITTEDGSSTSVTVLVFAVTQNGDTYDTTTTMTFRAEGIEHDALADQMLGGAGIGGFIFGPMMTFYGPAAFLLPMMLGSEEIRVRSEPMRVVGMGSIYMDSTETYAGRECVVLRFEPDDGGEQMVFALTEGLPFPCFSSYGDEGSRTILKLIEAR